MTAPPAAVGPRRRSEAIIAVLAAVVTVVLGYPGKAVAEPVTSVHRVAHVVVVGVSGLRWNDVDAARTPTLARMVDRGSVGSLSVRSAPGVTCPGEGWASLGSGTYAAVRDLDDIDPQRGCRSRQAPSVTVDGEGARVRALPGLRKLNDGLRFGAKPGLLGDSVRCTAAIGPGAALAVADRDGHVSAYEPSLPADPGPILRRCPLAAVDLGALPENRDRRTALTDLDRKLAAIDAARPSDSTVLLVGLSETGATEPRLHVASADGPGYTGGWLHSPSTRRIPYVQLVDVAPTALALLGQDVPDDIAGRPWQGDVPGRPDSLAATRKALVETDIAAVQQRAVLGWFFAGYAVLILAVLVALGVALWRRRRHQVSGRLLRALSIAALALIAVPGATFVANLLPWWRTTSPLALVTAGTAVVTALMVAVAYAGPWRRSLTGRMGAVIGITVITFSADVLAGSPLQIDSLFGYNPLVAGRFAGVGNIAFAVYGTAAVLLCAVLAAGRSRRAALGIVAAIGLPVLAIQGLPALGADFGGLLTLVPTFGVLALLLAGARITLGRVIAVVVAGIAAVGLIAVLDYLRPPTARSHFGRFVASLLDGDGWEAVRRKILTSLDLLLAGPLQVIALIGAVLVAVAVFRPPASLRAAYRDQPWLRPGLIGTVLLSAFGFATNDSGIAIPVVAALLAVPAALAAVAVLPDDTVAQHRARPEPTREGDGARTSETAKPEVGRTADVLP